MKNTAHALGWLFLCLWLVGCNDFKVTLTDLALEGERSRAGLSYKSTDIDGERLVYLDSTQPPSTETLLMVHGFAANKDNWVRLAAQFKAQYRVVIVDLPGHGDSSKNLQGHYDYASQVDALHAFVTKLELARFHLVGNSMGGAIASQYAARYPDQVGSLILFNPAGVFEHESELAQRLKRNENPLIVTSPEEFRALMDFALEEKPFIPWPVSDVLAQRAIANQELNRKIWADIRHFDPAQFLATLSRIQSPTLILWGMEDRIIHYRNADVFAEKITGARKVLLPDIGHAPMIEIPAQSASLMRDFIKG